ncbi:hypothetical protein [Flavobacterium orientale]|uniref:SGNH/GDSL hydrolase family protein n=1 Tax=Flavobacterium orientale TaxID=1756020 RepID=A0A916XYH2_9FLAO|nr:hypothetical protein [Flavobacterium orientale]GGD22062.1 hypothetical protein GCM10011343_10510 [Flavobacterium orientale]
MTNDLNYFLQSLLKFIPFSILFCVVGICLWGDFVPNLITKNLAKKEMIPGFMENRIADLTKTKEVDILFLGSSHAYRGFDTRLFKDAGYSSFNLGSSNQTPLQTEILLQRYLKQLQPKLVIYEVYPNTFSVDGVESTLDLLVNDKLDSNLLKLALKQNDITIYNTLIYSYYQNLFQKEQSTVIPFQKEEDNYIANGYVESEVTSSKKYSYKPQEYLFKSNQFDQFEKNLEILKKGNCKVILIQAPITKALYNSYSNNEFFDLKMKSYATYFNFNELMELNDSLHFYDDHHLNQKGVALFNQEIIKKIR